MFRKQVGEGSIISKFYGPQHDNEISMKKRQKLGQGSIKCMNYSDVLSHGQMESLRKPIQEPKESGRNITDIVGMEHCDGLKWQEIE
jgi:hypothetical protein